MERAYRSARAKLWDGRLLVACVGRHDRLSRFGDVTLLDATVAIHVERELSFIDPRTDTLPDLAAQARSEGGGDE